MFVPEHVFPELLEIKALMEFGDQGMACKGRCYLFFFRGAEESRCR